MIDREPVILVGILEGRPEIRGRFNGPFRVNGSSCRSGPFRAVVRDGRIVLSGEAEKATGTGAEIRCLPEAGATFSLGEVAIGIHFHWERRQEQTFAGNLILTAEEDGTLTAVNEVRLEDYLASVVSSEMNAAAPQEFLKAHAVTSRSWLAAMLERLKSGSEPPQAGRRERSRDGETIRWYGREEHRHFHVCADDHCQRYQGLTRMAENASAAVAATRGLFLVYGQSVCDARYYKACGGLTENFENAWEDIPVPYLTSISDAPHDFPPVRSEEEAAAWILSRPDAYCNTADPRVLGRILPDFDQETRDFFRWEVHYGREELESLLRRKSGVDFGVLQDLVPLERGPSGRIVRLRIEGSKRTMTVGKELEIRRWLSETHLYSSAFVVSAVRDGAGTPIRFSLRGAGWGHGVGLCQIGAAVMAVKGFTAEAILQHYFPAASLRRLY